MVVLMLVLLTGNLLTAYIITDEQLFGGRGRGVSTEACKIGRCEALERFHNESGWKG
jgi:hypothetical protein